MTFNLLQKNFDCVSPCPFFIRPHSSSSREAADFWRKSDSSEELKGSSSASASNNQSDWPLSPLMASEADISEAADASGHSEWKFQKKVLFSSNKKCILWPLQKLEKIFFCYFMIGKKSIFATKKRFKIMKKLDFAHFKNGKKTLFTQKQNKNHEKCNFSTERDQIFGLKLCTLFFMF